MAENCRNLKKGQRNDDPDHEVIENLKYQEKLGRSKFPQLNGMPFGWRGIINFHFVSFFFFVFAMLMHLLQPSPLIMIFAYSSVDNRIDNFVLVLAFVMFIRSYFGITLARNCPHARWYSRLLFLFAFYGLALMMEGMILINYPDGFASTWIMKKLKRYGYNSTISGIPSETLATGVRIFSTALGLSVANIMALYGNYSVFHTFKKYLYQ